jgi:hypothetical protein
MIPTATYSNQHPTSTCPNTTVFCPYPVNMSIAWTYRTLSVHFLAEFGHVGYPPHRCEVGNLGISSLVLQLNSLYLQIGKDILTGKAEQGWGAEIIERLSRTLRAAFLEMKGFSRAKMLYMLAFSEAWPAPSSPSKCKQTLPASSETEADLAGETLPNELVKKRRIMNIGEKIRSSEAQLQSQIAESAKLETLIKAILRGLSYGG